MFNGNRDGLDCHSDDVGSNVARESPPAISGLAESTRKFLAVVGCVMTSDAIDPRSLGPKSRNEIITQRMSAGNQAPRLRREGSVGAAAVHSVPSFRPGILDNARRFRSRSTGLKEFDP